LKSVLVNKALVLSAIIYAVMPASLYSAETVTHQYDELGRLIATSKSGGPVTGTSVATTYDPAGNRSNQTVNGAPSGIATPPSASSVVFSVSAEPNSVPQPGVARFTVSKSGLPGIATTVNFQTVAGSAQPTSDYTAQSGSLSFRSWETIKFVDVAVLTSVQAEAAESFSLQLSGPSSGTSIAVGSAIATATIVASGPPNQPPVTVFDTITVPACAPNSVNVLANDSDPEGGALTLISVTSASLANVSMGSSSGLVLVTGYGSAGADQVTYVVSDPQGATSSGILAITVEDGSGCARRSNPRS
jgi:YD repeat-containing protein